MIIYMGCAGLRSGIDPFSIGAGLTLIEMFAPMVTRKSYTRAKRASRRSPTTCVEAGISSPYLQMR